MENKAKKYVTTWGNAISIADRRPENYAKNLTLRYPIRPMFDADNLKITLDNFCGTEPVTITRVYVADSVNGGREIAEETNRQWKHKCYNSSREGSSKRRDRFYRKTGARHQH